jgi:ABC-type cobalt transport system substrate-binding protein
MMMMMMMMMIIIIIIIMRMSVMSMMMLNAYASHPGHADRAYTLFTAMEPNWGLQPDR